MFEKPDTTLNLDPAVALTKPRRGVIVCDSNIRRAPTVGRGDDRISTPSGPTAARSATSETIVVAEVGVGDRRATAPVERSQRRIRLDTQCSVRTITPGSDMALADEGVT